MSMQDDRKRYAGNKWSWEKRFALQMLRRLTADLEAGSDTARLVAVPGNAETGVPTLWLCTEDKGEYGEGYNQSTFCPPWC